MAKKSKIIASQKIASKPKVSDLSPTPGYLKRYKGKKLNSNFDLEDYAWIGKDGLLDRDATLKMHGYEPEAALELILDAIVSAYPSTTKATPEDRTISATAALLGKPKPKGNRNDKDYDLLKQIANTYFSKWMKNQSKDIEILPIARQIVNNADPKRFAGTKDSVARKLSNKFIKNMDQILARITTDYRQDLPDFHRKILRVLSDLEDLGIKTDMTSILSRINFMQSNTPI